MQGIQPFWEGNLKLEKPLECSVGTGWGAEEQELLVQDVELDLTGTAIRDPCSALVLLLHSAGAKQCWGGRQELGNLGSQCMDRHLYPLKQLSEGFLQTGEQPWLIMVHMGWALMDRWIFSCCSVKFWNRVLLNLSCEGMG